MEHTNQMSLLHGKHLPLLAIKYNRKTITAEAYMEGHARWPTAVLKSDNHLMMPFFLNKPVKSDHVAKTKQLYSVSALINSKFLKS